MDKKILLGLIFLVLSVFSIQVHAYSIDGLTLTYCNNISVNNSQNANLLMNYTLFVNTSGLTGSDDSHYDLRYANTSCGGSTATVLMHYRYNSTYEAVLINDSVGIPASGYKNISIYYGNSSSVIDSSRINATFLFGDDFNYSDAITNHGWAFANGTFTTVNGILNGTSAINDNYYALAIICKNTTATGCVIDADVMRNGTQNTAIGLDYNYLNQSFYYESFIERPPVGNVIQVLVSNASSTHLIGSTAAFTTTAGIWYHLQAITNATNLRNVTANYSTMTGGNHNQLIFNYTGIHYYRATTSDFPYFDNFTVRNYSSPEPKISVGSQETQGGGSSVNSLTLNTPTNGGMITSYSTVLNYTPTLYNGAYQNCTLWGNFTGSWLANATNSSIIVNNTVNNFSLSLNLDNPYLWNVRCYNSSTKYFESSNYTFTISAPLILNWYIDKPIANSVFSQNSNFTFNGTVNCTSGNCGNASIYPQYSNSSSVSNSWIENSSTQWDSGSYLGSSQTKNGLTMLPNLTAWWKDPNNPTFLATQAWENDSSLGTFGVISPDVVWDSSANLYKMWYTAGGENSGATGWRIGYATSPNGTVWDKWPDNPIMINSTNGQRNWSKGEVANPRVLIWNSSYYEMFYGGAPSPVPGSNSIGFANSTNGTNWTLCSNNPLINDTWPINTVAQDGTINAVFEHTVWVENISGTMYYFLAYTANGASNYRIYLINFTQPCNLSTIQAMNGGQPIITSNDIGQLEIHTNILVRKYNSTNNIYFSASNAYSAGNIVLAYSFDKIHWTWYNSGSAVISHDGGFEAQQIITPYFERNRWGSDEQGDNNTTIYYTGFDGSIARGGQAYANYTWGQYISQIRTGLSNSTKWTSISFTNTTCSGCNVSVEFLYSNNTTSFSSAGNLTSGSSINVLAKYGECKVIFTGNNLTSPSLSSITINYTDSSLTYDMGSTFITNTPFNCGILNHTNTNCTWTFNVTGTTLGNYNISITANSTAISNTSNNVNISISLLPPAWSLNQSTNPSIYDGTTKSEFNATWIGGTSATIELNYTGTPTNYSMTNSYGGNIWNYTNIINANYGNQQYWKSYGTNSSGTNFTPTWYFTINRASSPLVLTNNTSLSVTYSTPTSMITSGCPSQVSCSFTKNSVAVSSPDIGLFSAGSYAYVYSTSGNNNYSSNSTTKTLAINKKASLLSMSSTNGWNIHTGQSTIVSCSATPELSITLSLSGSAVSNPYTSTFASGSYVFSCSVNDTANYTPSSISTNLNVLSSTTNIGCTDNQTFAFTTTLNYSASQITLNFTPLVNLNLVRNDLNDVNISTANTTINKEIIGNNYLILVNSSNVTNFTLNFGNYFANLNVVNITKTNATIINFNYTQNSPYYYTFNFIDEMTGNLQQPPAPINSTINTTMYLYCSGGTTSFATSNNVTTLTVASFYQLNNIEYYVQYSPTEIYYRDYLISYPVQTLNVYDIDANNYQAVQLLIKIQDNTGTFTSPILHITKLLDSGTATINERAFDAELKDVVYLINGQAYTFTVTSGTQSRTIGLIYVDTVNLQKTLVIGDLVTTNSSNYNTSYGVNYNQTTGVINFAWNDPAGNTNLVDFYVYNYTNQTQTLFHGTSTNSSSVGFTYTVPDINGTYITRATIHNPFYGNNTQDIYNTWGASATAIIFTIPSLIASYNPGYGLTFISSIFLVSLPMTFGPALGGVMAIIVLIVALFLAYLGLYPVSIGLISLLVLFALMNKYSERRNEYT